MRRRDEGGFTLMEVTVTGLMSTMVLGALLGMLESGTRVDQRTQAAVTNQEAVRMAVGELLRDLRSADPVVTLGNAASYATTVELRRSHPVDDEYVRWRVDGAAGALVRESIAAPGATATATTYRLDGLSSAVFRYFNSAGAELTPATATSADIANCTIRVMVSVTAGPEAGPAPLTVTSDAEVRNRLPGGVGC